MKTEHTKGPWEIIGQDIFGNSINGFICTWSGNKADAQLIAAAPDLLQALKNLRDECKKHIPTYFNLEEADNAINKTEL